MKKKKPGQDLTYIIGPLVARLRNNKGLLQKELGELSGIHPVHVGDMERMQRNVSLITISAVCSGLDIKLSRFFSLVERIADGEKLDSVVPPKFHN